MRTPLPATESATLCTKRAPQRGFSLVELMIGLLIGLVATLAITRVFSQYEGQKRSIAGGADAQSSGLLAMYYLQRDLQNAGFGLPLNNPTDASPLLCALNTTIVQDAVAINLSPLWIEDGGQGSDRIRVRYGTSASGGASVRATGVMTAPALEAPLLGCQINDVVLFTQTPANPKCTLARLQALNSDRTIQALSELNTAPTAQPVTDLNGSERVQLSCLGVWNEYQYQLNTRQELTRTGGNPSGSRFPDQTAVAVVSHVVALQAQYGIAETLDTASTAITSARFLNEVSSWQDATGDFGASMTLADRNRIRAVRVAVVTRDPARHKTKVSQSCQGSEAGLAKVCIWTQDATPSSVVLGAGTDWQYYRYRVSEAVVPLRNLLWNRDAL